MYNPCVRQKKDPDGNLYPPNISPKINKVWEENATGDGHPDIEVFLGSEVPIKLKGWEHLMSLIPKRTPVTAIIQPRIWFVSGRFGISLKVMQLKVMQIPRSGPPVGYSFSKPPSKLGNKQANSTEQVESSNKESDEEVSNEEVSNEENVQEDEDEEVEDSDESDEEVEDIEES